MQALPAIGVEMALQLLKARGCCAGVPPQGVLTVPTDSSIHTLRCGVGMLFLTAGIPQLSYSDQISPAIEASSDPQMNVASNAKSGGGSVSAISICI